MFLFYQNKIQEIAKGRDKKFEMLAVEQQIRQAKEEEEILIAMNKKGKEDLLKAISEVNLDQFRTKQFRSSEVLLCIICTDS